MHKPIPLFTSVYDFSILNNVLSELALLKSEIPDTLDLYEATLELVRVTGSNKSYQALKAVAENQPIRSNHDYYLGAHNHRSEPNVAKDRVESFVRSVSHRITTLENFERFSPYLKLVIDKYSTETPDTPLDINTLDILLIPDSYPSLIYANALGGFWVELGDYITKNELAPDSVLYSHGKSLLARNEQLRNTGSDLYSGMANYATQLQGEFESDPELFFKQGCDQLRIDDTAVAYVEEVDLYQKSTLVDDPNFNILQEFAFYRDSVKYPYSDGELTATYPSLRYEVKTNSITCLSGLGFVGKRSSEVETENILESSVLQ